VTDKRKGQSKILFVCLFVFWEKEVLETKGKKEAQLKVVSVLCWVQVYMDIL